MTKELHKFKKSPSDPQIKLLEKSKNQVTDMEVGANIRMAPKKIDPRDFQKSIDYKVEKSKTYLDFIQLNPKIKEFSNLLIEFLIEYINNSTFRPIECKLLIFNFPGEDYSEPMIKFIYPDVNEFDNLKIKDDIKKDFKIFLVNNSKDLKQFQTFRQIQLKFRFIIRRE